MLSDLDIYQSTPGSDWDTNLTPEKLSTYVARGAKDVRAREESETLDHLNPEWVEWVRARGGEK